MNEKDKYSVLMSVYYKEKPEWLVESINSILNQTVGTNDFVIVCDGELTKELNQVLDMFQQKFSFINVVRYDKNMGLGYALNYGLEYCRNDIIARMDSDDISFPERCEIQLTIMLNNTDLSAISAHVMEFSNNNLEKTMIKKVPITNNQIAKYSQSRNPMNHPVIMFRKQAIQSVGGYMDFPHFEDYYLWIRLILAGKMLQNIDKPLLYMRTNIEIYKRRGGVKYFVSAKKFQDFLFERKHIGFVKYCINIGIRFIVQVIFPNKIRAYYFKYILRKI